jgi:ABC-2 type transport system permease protein
MRKMLIVLRHEFRTIISKPSFWFGIIGTPIIMGAIFAGIGITSGAATVAVIAQQRAQPSVPQGYVDQADIVAQAGEAFEAFGSEREAQAALDSGQIEAYYVIPPDYLQTGQVRMVAQEIDDTPLGPRQKTAAFDRMLRANLLGDEALAAQVSQRANLDQSTSVAPVEDRRGGPILGGFSPLVYGIAILFFIVLMTASAYLMQAVTTEKENRVIEVLMSSVTPTQLLAGKILGLGLIGLIQLVLWFGTAVYFLTTPFIRDLIGPIAPSAVLLTVLFFILGYFVYASLLAGLGALMPGAREAAQYSFLVLLPLFIPLYLNTAIGAEPDGPLAVGLSLFPFTAPIVMPMRMFATDVPAAQVAISLALLVGLVYFAATGAARAFRAQSLLSGSKPTLKQVVAAFRT